MHLALIVTALALPSSATAAARRYYPDQLIAVAPGHSSINEFPLNAIDGFFHIGPASLLPTTSCPGTAPRCPPGNVTALIYSRDQAALDAAVPGGQYVFVDSDGYLAYTAPGAGIVPVHAAATGFRISGPEEGGEDKRGRFHFNGTTARGRAVDFAACPDGRVVVRWIGGWWSTGRRRGECVEIEVALRRYESSMPAAWQFDVKKLE